MGENFEDFEADFPKKCWIRENIIGFPIYIKSVLRRLTIQIWNCEYLVGILQVLRLQFQKFRILEVLNFHPCNILGQKRNAAYKTYIVYGGLSPISRKRFVIVWALVLGLWVPGVVLAIIVTGRNWFSSLHLRFYRYWRRVIGGWRHECARSDIVPICQKRFLSRSIILAWHWSCWAITDVVTLACNILIAFSHSTCVRFGIVN